MRHRQMGHIPHARSHGGQQEHQPNLGSSTEATCNVIIASLSWVQHETTCPAARYAPNSDRASVTPPACKRQVITGVTPDGACRATSAR